MADITVCRSFLPPHRVPKFMTFAACQLTFSRGHKWMRFYHHSDEDIPGVEFD